MIGLDTNVIVRYLTQDDPEQAKLANQVISNAIQKGELLWISHLTLAETTWVLERAYQLPKSQLIDILSTLLQTQDVTVEKHNIAWQALQDYKKCKKTGFVDCLIGRQNASSECRFTYTFDRTAAHELHTFQQLKS
jgi:predicted nucleic-acid-binding protein